MNTEASDSAAPDALASIDDVLSFWFGPPEAGDHNAPRAAWFRKDPAFDALIAQRFGATIEVALAGGLPAWSAQPQGALALILLLDQFTRNAFRGQARAFAGDALALALAQHVVTAGWDRALPGVQRQFVYLPFEHAEDRAMQTESLRLFAALGEAHPALGELLDWARRHADIIERFGRFPHRNEVLGRVSTAEELEFLRQPGSGF